MKTYIYTVDFEDHLSVPTPSHDTPPFRPSPLLLFLFPALRRRSLLIPSFDTWARHASFLRMAHRNASLLRHRRLCVSLRCWHRAAGCRGHQATLQSAHARRERARLFRAWVNARGERARLRHSLKHWAWYRAKRTHFHTGERHYQARLTTAQHQALRRLARLAKTRRFLATGATHASRLLRCRGSDLLLRWHQRAHAWHSLRTARDAHRRHLSTRAHIAIHRLRLSTHLTHSHRAALASEALTLARRAARAFVKWKRQTARRLLCGVASLAHARRSRRRAFGFFRRHARIARFARVRRLRSARPASLQSRHLLQQGFKRWVAWLFLRLTLELCMLFWQRHDVRRAFVRWHRVHGRRPSRLVQALAHARRVMLGCAVAACKPSGHAEGHAQGHEQGQDALSTRSNATNASYLSRCVRMTPSIEAMWTHLLLDMVNVCLPHVEVD